MTETISVSHCHRPAHCGHKGTWPKRPRWLRWRNCIWTQQQDLPLTKAQLASLTTERPCQKQRPALILWYSIVPSADPAGHWVTNWAFPILQGLAIHSKRNWQIFQRGIILSCLQGLGQHHLWSVACTGMRPYIKVQKPSGPTNDLCWWGHRPMTAELVITHITRPRNCWPEKEHQSSETTAEAPAPRLVKDRVPSPGSSTWPEVESYVMLYSQYEKHMGPGTTR